MNLMKKVLVAVCALSLVAGQNVYAGRLMVTVSGFAEMVRGLSGEPYLEKTVITLHIDARDAQPEFYNYISSPTHAHLKLYNQHTGEKFDLQAEGFLRTVPQESRSMQGWASFYGNSDPDGIPDNADDVTVAVQLGKNWMLSGQDIIEISLYKGRNAAPFGEKLYDTNIVSLRGGNVRVEYLENKKTESNK